MTVREWFRVQRREYEAYDPDESVRFLFTALRQGDWTLAEFWWLLLRSRLDAASSGVHQWTLSSDGYRWVCTWCGAEVPSVDIGETDPDPSCFDAGCQCKACLPCPGGL